MITTSLNITGKLPEGLVELYQIINEHAIELEIPYLVVGATARDIVLVYGYGANIERGTRDVDFGIQVQTWEQFEQLRALLLESGFKQDPVKVHQLTTVDSKNMPWEVDIVPFGEITQNKDDTRLHTIAWPPKEEIVMNVMGFNEALLNALTVTISKTPELHIKVTSPECMLFLKLISWLERDPIIRRKDAADIYYLTKHYSKIPEVLEALYEQDFMEKQNYDELKACAMKLAREAAKMAEPDTVKYINERLFSDERMLDNLTLDMSRNIQIEYEEAESLLNIIKKQFREAE